MAKFCPCMGDSTAYGAASMKLGDVQMKLALFALALAGVIFLCPSVGAEAGWLGTSPAATDPIANSSRQLLEIKKNKQHDNDDDDNGQHVTTKIQVMMRGSQSARSKTQVGAAAARLASGESARK